ncbi:MAG: ABC transporter substrate-binding protein [Oculatellaceae cyanobacterium Prado106]|nr:ABC transporter substrate-binding protein [Oculatellaceae cyanobacterium Prado106]
MAQKNDTPALVLSLLITAALIGGGLWWFMNRFNPSLPTSTTVTPPTRQPANLNPNNPVAFQDRFSQGEKLLVAEGASPEKKAGIEAIAAKNFPQAITALETSLQNNRNDPEALIYLNNARIGDQPARTIAVSVPTTQSTNPALEILRGVAQAQTQINQAGGINGTPLRVQIVNDDNDANTCKEVAAALVQDQSVLGVIGHFGSDATLAAGPVYEQGRLVMISPTSTSVQVATLGDYVFRTVPSDRFTASALSRHMLNNLQLQNAVVFFNSESAYSQSLKDEFTTALTSDGGQVTAEVDLKSPGFNAQSAVKQATQQGVQALVLAANTATLDQALQVVSANNQQLRLLGGDSLYNPKVLQSGGATAEGMVVAVPWILLSNPNSPFAEASRRLWGGDVNWRSAMAYDATQALIEGIRSNPSRQGVQSRLASSNFSFNGATGTVRFLASGDRNQPMQLVVIQPGSRSGYGYDFVPAPQ